jgi:hypothetical protein
VEVFHDQEHGLARGQLEQQRHHRLERSLALSIGLMARGG